MRNVKVYGPGCKRCEDTENMITQVAAKLNISIVVEKVSDPREIAMAGIMSTPGISVDGKLVHAGGLPNPAKLEDWLSA